MPHFTPFHPRDHCIDSDCSHHSTVSVVSCSGSIEPLTVLKSRTVSFESKVQMWKHVHRQDYSAEEKESCWFTREDYDEMKDEREATIGIMESGQTMIELNDEEHHYYSYRGLERKIQEGARRRQLDMANAQITVFQEQSRQQSQQLKFLKKKKRPTGRRRGVCDPEAVSRLYIESTAHCAQSARERGLNDQRAAANLLVESSLI
jgi:hypothetical protein